MLDFDLLQENPSLFFIILILSIITTIFVYGVFPVIFAKARKAPITKKKYKRLCYGINIIGLVFFVVLNGAVSGGPYLLWTSVFSHYGVKILGAKSLLTDIKDYDKEIRSKKTASIYWRKKESTEPKMISMSETGNSSKPDITTKTDTSSKIDTVSKTRTTSRPYVKNIDENDGTTALKILFCRKCGNKIPEDSNFCQYCGTKINISNIPMEKVEVVNKKVVTERFANESYSSEIKKGIVKDDFDKPKAKPHNINLILSIILGIVLFAIVLYVTFIVIDNL